jgi:hypothetical protein
MYPYNSAMVDVERFPHLGFEGFYLVDWRFSSLLCKRLA